MQIKNIVATANLGGSVDLPQLFESSGEILPLIDTIFIYLS